MGERKASAYREQVNALGAQGVALVEVLKVIGERGVRHYAGHHGIRRRR